MKLSKRSSDWELKCRSKIRCTQLQRAANKLSVGFLTKTIKSSPSLSSQLLFGFYSSGDNKRKQFQTCDLERQLEPIVALVGWSSGQTIGQAIWQTVWRAAAFVCILPGPGAIVMDALCVRMILVYCMA